MSTVVTPGTTTELLVLYRKSGLYDEAAFRKRFPHDDEFPVDARESAAELIRTGFLTNFQAKQLLAGRHRGFTLGTYRILQPIGQGGMGVVFLGEHTSLKRRVAIKVLPAEKAKDRLTIERFYREARAAAALSHPNIVGLYDVSQGGGVHFLAMEYVEGTDLQALMAKTGPLHHAQAASYIAQAAAGLQHAHGKGIVHRDIKPANLILAKDGVIKILDMGLARSLTNTEDQLTGLMGEGEVSGTADYIAPEQALGQPSDERADIYSLGATLYSLVAGHPPFSGSTTQKLMQHQLKDPPSLNKKLAGRVPPALADVVMKMMAKRPSERYQTPEDVIDALGPWLPAPTTGSIVGEPLSQSATSLSRQIKKKKKRSNDRAQVEERTVPVWVWGAGVATLMLLLIGGGVWLLTGNSKPAVVSAPPGFNSPVAPPQQTTPQASSPQQPPTTPPPAATDVVRTPLAVLPGDERFLPLSLASVVNVSTNRLLFDKKVKDALVLSDWSDRRIEGVPFVLLPPRGDEPNVVEFFSPNPAAMAMELPKTVTVPVGVAAARLHFLSGVSAWGFPYGDATKGGLVLTVVLRYEGGRTEEQRWENGVHFCDYVGNHNVPESKHAITFSERRTVRYLTIVPTLDAVIKQVEFVRNERDDTIPILMAMTVEARTPGQKGKTAAPAPKDSVAMIPLQLPNHPNQAASPIPAPKEILSVGEVDFPPGSPGIVLVPKEQTKVSCFLATKVVHVLGSVGPKAEEGLVKVRLQYSAGEFEEYDWRAGGGISAGESHEPLRLLTITPRRNGVLQSVSFENVAKTNAWVLGVVVEPH